jgi:actin-related protein
MNYYVRSESDKIVKSEICESEAGQMRYDGHLVQNEFGEQSRLLQNSAPVKYKYQPVQSCKGL